MAYIPAVFFAILCAGSLVLVFVSRSEGESRAARRACVPAGITAVLTAASLLIPSFLVPGLVVAVVTVIAVVVLIWPTGRANVPSARHDLQVDERTVMFSRAAIKPGDGRYETYYELHPEHRETDDRRRSKPGLLSREAVKYEPLSFAAAEASFCAVEELAPLVRGEVAGFRVEHTPEAFTRFIKGWALKLGAHSCGITELQDRHLYTVKGRGPRWGEEVTKRHTWAIVVSVEMDHRQMASAPDGPTIMESAQQYLESGRIAVQMAEACRRLGWEAEAHIDANYELICPPVARDAGLGEIGRMGLLMTPRLGPRVRLAVVTTNLPLLADEPTDEPSVLDFCAVCEKCAEVCPAEAIPRGPRADQEGRLRWVIDQEACFSYWCSAGTDCGRCMAVCPYSHPGSLVHDLVRWGLKRSSLFRRAALRGDDWLYGRRPGPRTPADWLGSGPSGAPENPA